MLFRPELCKKVMTGEKTMTRRIVKPGYWLVTYPDGRKAVIDANDGRIKWQTGKTYAIQPGRGKASIGRLKLLDIRQERVRDISEEDAIAEGVERNCEGVPLVCPACQDFGKCRAEGEYIHYLRGEGGPPAYSAVESFLSLFESISGKAALDGEVWVLTFELVDQQPKTANPK